jgi:cellulose biosynthesis protein BcsQ
MRAVAVFQLKGGVGKTTSAVNLAALAAADGIPTLLWDLDPQGGATWVLGEQSQSKQNKFWVGEQPLGPLIQETRWPHLHLIAADLSLRKFQQSLAGKAAARAAMSDALSLLSEQFGLVLIDCPPALTPQMEGVLRAVDRLLVPVQPSGLSLHAYQQLRQQLDWVKNKQWLPFVTMLDKRKQAQVRWAREQAPDCRELLPTFITYSASAEKMLELRQPIVTALPQVPLSRSYRALWQQVKPRLNLR